MSDVGPHSAARIGASGGLSGLRGRIGWICHAIRIAAVLWSLWIVGWAVALWSDKARLLAGYSRLLATDVSGVSDASYYAAIVLVVVNCMLAAAIAYCIWQLCATYLAGRIFTVDAALWLRRTAIVALTAIGFGIFARFAVVAIFAGQIVLLPARGQLLVPQDLLHLIFVFFVFGLAYIFKTAAEMADDQAQIV